MTTAWYDAPSHAAGAAFAATVGADVDVRASGVQVWADDPAVAEAARKLGLTRGELRTLDVVIEAADPVAVQAFWDGVLGEDTLRRHPTFSVRRL
ncbi:MAG: hypothetical protein HOV67_06085, partial [Kribbellaceae bacterium]|nr:hypothetical protein [Kribbellaceae bacterium]